MNSAGGISPAAGAETNSSIDLAAALQSVGSSLRESKDRVAHVDAGDISLLSLRTMADLRASLEAWEAPIKRKRGGRKQRERREAEAAAQQGSAASAPATVPPAAETAAPPAAAPAAAPAAKPAAPPAAAPAAPPVEDDGLPPLKRKRGGRQQRERDEAAAAAEAERAASEPARARAAAPAAPSATSDRPPCEHFTRGTCTRGDKCRFSHDAAAGATTSRKKPGAQARRKAGDWAANQGAREPERGESVYTVCCRGHDEPCVKRAVNKPGSANHGRSFLSCRKWRDKGGCGHFAWLNSATGVGSA